MIFSGLKNSFSALSETHGHFAIAVFDRSEGGSFEQKLRLSTHWGMPVGFPPSFQIPD
jgi:hypothetical protein